MNTDFGKHFLVLQNYCEQENFKGYDPYDGLNSKIFQSIPFIRNNRFLRLAWIQFFKQCPVNFRPVVGIKKDYNPKGLGLFLSGYCNLYKADPNPEYLEKIKFLTDKICACQSQGYSGACWGYNFDWQARVFFQPKYSPTVVATSFIANALLDAYELTGNEHLLEVAISSCNFVLSDLNRTPVKKGFVFSYSPVDKTSVYNASLLGARLLARCYSITKKPEYLEAAHLAILGVCESQNENGSWYNAIESTQQWIDNFHTAYNLECMNDYQLYTGDFQFNDYLQRGFDYYINTFFTPKGEPKYYNNQLYPIDIHCCSQLFITLYKLNVIEKHQSLFQTVWNWTIANMQSSKGFFYYQKRRCYTNRVPYMRWTQAWMFYAMSLLNLYKKGINYDIKIKDISKG